MPQLCRTRLLQEMRWSPPILEGAFLVFFPAPIFKTPKTHSSLQRCSKPTSSTSSVAPTPTGAICGSRGLPACPDGTTCVNDPSKPGCDIAVDCPGICVKPSTSTITTRATAAICGGRGLPLCPDGTTCVNDPRKPSCDISADCPGICVKLDGPFCGGFAGFPCPQSEQVCIDDPRDDCAPPTGADCGGTCVFLDGRSSAPPNS